MTLTGTARRRVRGHLQNVSPAAFVQMIAIERETCALVVREEGRDGVLFFVGGDLLDARLGEVRGEEAALQILGWQLAEVETQLLDETPPRSINAPLTFILLEAMRRRDEGLFESEEPPPAALETGAISAVAAAARPKLATGEIATMAATPAEMLAETFLRDLEGLTGVCLIDFNTGSPLAERFSSTAGYDTAPVSRSCFELARAELALAAKLSPGSTLAEIVLTFDNILIFLRLLQPDLVLVLVADPAHTGLPNIHAALRRLAPFGD